MQLAPGYGETPLPGDEFIALLSHVAEALGKPVRRADVYDLEQAVQDEVSEELLADALRGVLSLDDLLSDHFLRDLHSRLYRDIWVWAGKWRQHEVNIGVAPERIAVELRNTFDSIRGRADAKVPQSGRVGGLSRLLALRVSQSVRVGEKELQ